VKADTPAAGANYLARHEFLIRRLHSLSGLIPVGAYMVIHLLTNATVLDSPAAYQRNVYSIHSFGAVLPVIEWVFIFIPLLFHAIFGVVIIRGGLPNSSTYKYTSNVRYTLQRATGMIAFAFIMWHVFHMHGWFHADWWMHNIAEPLGGGKFRAFAAASTGAEAMRMSPVIVPILYAIGVLSCVFHLANGIWTFGITWGLWVTPQSQRRADYACIAFGVLLGLVGLSALWGFAFQVNVDEARQAEERMFKAKLAAGEVTEDVHKLRKPDLEPTKETASSEPTPSAKRTSGE
jgi:succinate dehydrogenase / fumarate reductase cytochrome b subunit